jgi:hypothetical protein
LLRQEELEVVSKRADPLKKVTKVPKVKEFYPSSASLREPQGLKTGSNDLFYKRWSRARP